MLLDLKKGVKASFSLLLKKVVMLTFVQKQFFQRAHNFFKKSLHFMQVTQIVFSPAMLHSDVAHEHIFHHNMRCVVTFPTMSKILI